MFIYSIRVVSVCVEDKGNDVGRMGGVQASMLVEEVGFGLRNVVVS